MKNISMRQQFIESTHDIMRCDKRVVCLLNDIGVWGFRNVKSDFPDRIYNMGILEQGTTSIAAGLSLVNMIPVFYTIAPFIVERAYEQLKDDFSYQCINGNFVSVGASFDYSKLGMTHYCPGDIGAILQLPNFEIMVPGTSEEFDYLYRARYESEVPSYYRLSEKQNSVSQTVEYGKLKVIKEGSDATVLVVGNMLDSVVEAADGLNVTIAYCTTIRPFDIETLKAVSHNNKFLICEPYYSGAISQLILEGYQNEYVMISEVGIPKTVLNTYGTYDEIIGEYDMDSEGIKQRILKLINGGVSYSVK